MDADQFHVEIEADGPLPVVRVRGELDMATASVLRGFLIEVVAQNPGRHIVVDLEEMSFIDSTGLGVLVGGLKRARDQAGDLLLASVPSMTRRVLEITGMDGVFEIIDQPVPVRGAG